MYILRMASDHIWEFIWSHSWLTWMKVSEYVGTKGQLISKCLLEKIVWTKIATKKFDNFCPGGQIKKIKAHSYINYGVFNVKSVFIFLIWPPGQKLSNFFVAILVQMIFSKRRFEINWPLKKIKFARIWLILVNKVLRLRTSLVFKTEAGNKEHEFIGQK